MPLSVHDPFTLHVHPTVVRCLCLHVVDFALFCFSSRFSVVFVVPRFGRGVVYLLPFGGYITRMIVSLLFDYCLA